MAPKAKAKRTCLEEAEHDEARPVAKQQRLRKQNTEQQVAKAIKDNCSDMSASEIDGTMVMGKTLRQTLLSDKRAVKTGDSNETFGKKYYEKLRDTYCSNESPAKLLLCNEDTLPVDPDLFSAMVSLKRTPVNRCSDHGQTCTYIGYTFIPSCIALCSFMLGFLSIEIDPALSYVRGVDCHDSCSTTLLYTWHVSCIMHPCACMVHHETIDVYKCTP